MTLAELRPKNLSIYTIATFMVLIPLIYFYNPIFGMASLRIIQAQTFELGAIILFAIFILQNVWLSLFLLWTIVLYVMNDCATPIGQVMLIVTSGCLIYEAVYRIVNRDNFKIISNFLIWFAIANVVYMIFQAIGWDVIYQEFSSPGIAQHQLIGFLGIKATSGMFFAIAMPFFVSRYPVASLLLFLPIYVSECSAAMGAAIIAYLWQLWHISKLWFTIMCVVLGLGGIFYAYNDSHAGMFTDRANMWKTALKDAVKKPIFGWGPDSFRCVTPDKQFMYWKNVRTKDTKPIDVRDTIEYRHTGKYDLTKYGSFMQKGDTIDPWDNPHNEYLKLFYEFGIIPFIFLGLLIHDIHNRFSQDKYLIPLVGFFFAILFMSIGQFPFEMARIGIFIPIFLACYYKLSEEMRVRNT